jgi:hypothetical protein
MSSSGERDSVEELGRELFRAARREGPSREARQRARALLSAGVVSSSLLGAGKASAAGASSGAGGAGLAGKTAVAKFMAGTAGMLIKIAGIGIVGTVAWMALPRAREAEPPLELTAERTESRELEKPAASVSLAPAEPALPVPLERGHVTLPEQAQERSARVTREPGANARAPRNARPARAPDEQNGESLKSELGLLDQARRELLRGGSAQALSVLDRYGGQFARGQLASEAAALRVEALVRNGQRSAAADVGQRFIAQHPNDPLVDRIRSLLAAARGGAADADSNAQRSAADGGSEH